MASLLSLPLTTPTRTTVVLHHSYSSFKGNVRNLKANQCTIPSLKIHLKTKVSKPLVILDRASPSLTTSDATPNARFRLDNLRPQPGSRKKAKRKGRGIFADQGSSCGFGMRGQKSRSSLGVRRGFEGGQMPLY